MNPLYQLSTRNYDKELGLVTKAMQELETTCNVKNGYELFPPSNMAGWTFFNLQLSSELLSVIEKSGMMEGALGLSKLVTDQKIILNMYIFYF